MTMPEVSRGLAFGDLDNDGAIDVVVGNDAGPVQVLRNSVGRDPRSGPAGPGNHWIGLRLLDSHGRDALGARVTLKRADGRTLMRRVRADGSYASANDPRVVIGLGSVATAGDVQILWPDGQMETRPVSVDRYTTITQGKT